MPLSPFENEFSKLNPGQQSAVETIEGPVMVIAGPGTGKTQTVAMRVANILRKTHARPGNILCLTFSTSGATAMRERLRKLIGPDAYGVTVRNFHGFCNDLIQDHPLVFDQWSALEQISDVERYRQINKILDDLLPDLVLVNRKSPYLRTREIISRISELKRESVTDRKKLLQIADEYEQTKASESKEGTKAHEKNLLAARKFREFLEVFFRYQQMLSDTQRYDYDDMILHCIKALEEEDWLLASLQERYLYILVDEFQDTNGAQYRLIELLSTARTPEDKPNLFVVGDDDQAIYRFQGANLANIMRFHERFPAAPVIALRTSYRCTQAILDAAGSLISRNTERLVGRVEGLEKTLQAALGTQGEPPTLLLSESDTAEPWMIADLISGRIAKGVSPQEIAVLCQTNAEVLRLFEVLRAKSIPVEVQGKVDLLNHPLVRQCVAILKAVASPETTSAFAGALACDCFGCHSADLGRLFLYQRERKDNANFLKTMFDVGSEATVSEFPVLLDAKRIIHARDIIVSLHEKLPSRTIVETMEHLLKDTGLIASQMKEDHAIDPSGFAALQEFFDRVKYRAYEQPGFSFQSFLSDLEYYEQPEYSDLRMSYSLPHLTEEGVQLMTAHQSKGMEFSIVILPNFREGHWDKRRNPSSLSIPEDLLFGWEKDKKTFEHSQDERRLAFVAMTRAKRELIFTCPKELTSGDKLRTVSPSAFFAEAGTLPEKSVELKDPSSAALLLYSPARDIDAELRVFLLSRLETYALSVTALNHFLEDPKLFLEVDLLQMPQAKKSELVFGNAVHDALKKWGHSIMEKKPFEKVQFLSAFDAYLDNREVLTDSERRRLKKEGQEILPRYFDERLAVQTPCIFKVEYPLSTHCGDVPIKGKIDRIDLIDPLKADAVIFDYKTGAPKSENAIRGEGNYFRQLVFYALLLEEQHSILKSQSFVLDFIGQGTDHPIQRSFMITQEEIDSLKQVVTAVWSKITALDFSPL
jgi:DNA helicase-2/ATP-dependent DNA helicase PcrA